MTISNVVWWTTISGKVSEVQWYGGLTVAVRGTMTAPGCGMALWYGMEPWYGMALWYGMAPW